MSFMIPQDFSRRQFLTASAAALLAAGHTARAEDSKELTYDSTATTQPSHPAITYDGPIIDIHQHTDYSGRTDEQLLLHQRNMGVSQTVLLPAGHPVKRPSTHMGKSNGLAAQCGPIETCYRIVQEHPGEYFFFANEVPDVENAREEIEKYLKLGALGIGEEKFNIDVESPAFDVVAGLAGDYDVPLLMHIQYQMYNHGFDRFWRVLEKYPRTRFIGHAQTMWANIDKLADQKVLYPKTPVKAGGLTDRYLRDYPNFFADISAGSGLNSMLRDEEHARAFLLTHQDKIMYGSDCNDRTGKIPDCQGVLTIGAIKRLAPSKEIARKILHDNAARELKIPALTKAEG
jgi:predicted TIM-barrel fold metal-dependent hydrolase